MPLTTSQKSSRNLPRPFITPDAVAPMHRDRKLTVLPAFMNVIMNASLHSPPSNRAEESETAEPRDWMRRTQRSTARSLNSWAPFFALALLFASLLLGFAARAQDTPRTDVLDLHHLPLGDGKVSSDPRRGYVMSCMTAFRGGGAQHAGPWIHGDTWDMTQKISVQGRVTWPEASFRITTQGADRLVSRVLQGNGLPVDTPTGTFPIAYDDPAFQIDHNPNSIAPQDILLSFPSNPDAASTP